MKVLNATLAASFLAGTVGLSATTSGADEILLKVVISPGYCHMKFPAMERDTLGWNRPVLQDPSDGDIIDYYGPCNYDPRGKEEVFAQRSEYALDAFDE